MNKLYSEFLKFLRGKRIMVCGLGLSNAKIIEIFYNAGAQVIACDARDRNDIKPEIIDYIISKGISHRFGKGYIDNLNCDIIVRTPGMNFLSPTITKARNRGIIVTSEIEIFFDLCPCKIIGITGSDGKTTVTTIISEILKNSGKKVFVGGNIGTPLLPQINNITENDIVVAELSSFQLISMRKSPDISVITNISPNHLDIHRDMDEYVNAKKNIILHQGAFSKAILNYDNQNTRELSSYVRGKVLFFSSKSSLSNGVWVNNQGDIIFSKNFNNTKVINSRDIKIPGHHNLENYLAAIATVWEDTNVSSIKNIARDFSGVEHRMEFVKIVNGVSYYNDSIGTSPNRVICGCLSFFKNKIILIAGGYDKHIPFDNLGEEITKKVKIIILFGQTAGSIEKAVKNSKGYYPGNPKIIQVNNMEEAVNMAKLNSVKGDHVVLSPACASFGYYKNFEERGNHFKKLVNDIKEI